MAIATHGNGVYTMNLNHSADFVGVKKMLQPNSYNIYPNPSNNKVYISGYNEIQKEQISLYRINGQRVLFDIELDYGDVVITPLTDVGGVFVLNIKQNSASFTQRLLFYP